MTAAPHRIDVHHHILAPECLGALAGLGISGARDRAHEVIALSTAFTLEPGDVVSTGTPSGVGALANPPRFLAAGDLVRVEIERLGSIENRVVAEPADTVRV